MRVPLIVATRVDDFSGGSRHHYFVLRLPPMIRRHRSFCLSIRVGVVLLLLVLSCHVKKKKSGDYYSDIYLFKKCSLLHFTSLHVKRNGKGRTKRRRRRREKKRIDEHASSSSPRRDHRAESATSVPPTHPRREKKSKANDETRGETHRTTKMDGNVDEIVVRQKTPNESDVLTILMIAFAVAMALLALVLRRAIAKIFKNRNVSRDEEEQKTIKRDYARSVTMRDDEDSFTMEDFVSLEKKNKKKNKMINGVNNTIRVKEKSPLVKRVSIDETENAGTRIAEETESETKNATKQKPSSNALSQQSLITVEERSKIAELRQLVNDEKDVLLSTDALKMYCSDAQLARNLRARKWDVLKAFEMLKKTLLWRKEYKPELITFEDIEEELQTGKQYRSGRDRSGRRIVVMRPSRENTREHDGNIRLLVYTFENALWRTNGERVVRGSTDISALAQEQICVLINFTKWSIKLSPPWRTSMETLHIMQEHYPERLGLAVCYDPPSVFSVFWKLISPFIDVKTKSKIRFVQPRGDKEKAARKMNEMFHPNTIDSDMGGRVDATWDIDEYQVFLRRYDEVKRSVFEVLAARKKDHG